MRCVNRMGRLYALLIALAAALLTATACAGAQSDVPPLEQRAQNLNKTIMCPVCPGESIDQSQNTLAVQMRGIVDDKIAMGWSDARIRGFFVERYGPSVLLDPPTEGIGLAVWVGAPLGVALALAAFALALRHMRRPTAQDGGDGSAKPQAPKDDDASSMDETDAELQPYYERIEAAMRGDGDGE